MAQLEQESLDARLARYPVDRYPAQHATTQFHLGSELLHAGQAGSAIQALTVAVDVFERIGMRLERAKALVMLGVALRAGERPEQAAAAFTAACAEFAALDQPAEQAAAAYNLGLVRQDVADLDGAQQAWSQARDLFLAAGYPAQAGAAARDHGACLLAMGEPAQARPLLEQALALADRAGDGPGAGAAGNALGLAELAVGEAVAAVATLQWALAAFGRGVRPAEYAMVKANLALAYEQAGNRARARLAAGQALSVDGIAAPVRAQARQLLERLPGQAQEDLLAVLDGEHQEQWVPVLREEVLRASGLPAEQRCELVSGFLDGVLARPGASYDLAESLLQVVLELPPRTYQLLVSALVDASARRPEQQVVRLRAVIGSAMARFALPQWQRLAASLNAAAREAGRPAEWR